MHSMQQRQGDNATEQPESNKHFHGDAYFCCLCMDAMDVLEDLMSKRKWKKQCLRANVAQPEDIVTYGTVKVAKIYSNVLNKR